MNLELTQIIFMALSGSLFALGGTTNKVWRRYALPIIVLCYLYLNQAPQILSILSILILSLFLHIGYGESRTWLWRLMVGFMYATPSLLIRPTIWFLILPFVWFTLFFLSNWPPTRRPITWKIVEFLTGTLIAISYIGALNV